MPLKVGFDIFAGASQGGTNSGVRGNLQAEAVVAGKHCVEVRRLSDNFYWNHTTQAYQGGQPAEADEMEFLGSAQTTIAPAIRRLSMKLPDALIAGATAAGISVLVYPTTLRASGAPVTALLTATYLF